MQTGQPTLIGTRSIEESQRVAERLTRSRVHFHLLNGVQDADEADVIGQAGRVGAVTIATGIAGRGTDIVPGRGALQRGGLHVIALGHHESRRIDRQLIGRAARQGQPGSAQFHVCAQDDLLAAHAPRVRQRLLTAAGNGMPVSAELTRAIESTQRRVEKVQFQQRRRMFLADQKRGDVLRKFTGEAS